MLPSVIASMSACASRPQSQLPAIIAFAVACTREQPSISQSSLQGAAHAASQAPRGRAAVYAAAALVLVPCATGHSANIQMTAAQHPNHTHLLAYALHWIRK